MPASFFDPPGERIVDGVTWEWFSPTDLSRGPWDADACHGGPPTALLVRAVERLVPAMALVRISVELAKPVPMAGFRVVGGVTRSGRSVAGTSAVIVDAEGQVRASAVGLHLAPLDSALFDGPRRDAEVTWPRLAEATPGPFPISRMAHGRTGFRDAVTVRYPPGEATGPGATAVWMQTVDLVAGEQASPFQRICPLADCGNAFSRHTEIDEVGFINPDLTIALHRPPSGDWFGMRSASVWQPSGIGVCTSTLFDDDGPVGTAVQTLLLRPTS